MKIKLIIGALLSLVSLGASYAFAAFDDASLQSGGVISSNGVTINITGTASVVETLTVNAGTFTTAMRDGSKLSITMPDRNIVAYSTDQPGTDIFSVVCDSSASTIEVNHSSSTASTITFTPSSSLCGGSAVAAASGGPISSGGGGGGGGSYTPPVTTTPAPTATQTQAVALTTFTFTRSLSSGVSGADVSELQRVLALDPNLYPEANVSGYFGGLTQKAVQRFQEKYGIASAGSQGYGVFGPATRAKFMNAYGPTSSNMVGSVVDGGIISTMLKKGMTHAQVKILQTILNKDPETMISSSGAGSPGSETEFFGSLTEKAVIKFQTKHSIDPVGFVGPKTRAKLNSI